MNRSKLASTNYVTTILLLWTTKYFNIWETLNTSSKILTEKILAVAFCHKWRPSGYRDNARLRLGSLFDMIECSFTMFQFVAASIPPERLLDRNNTGSTRPNTHHPSAHKYIRIQIITMNNFAWPIKYSWLNTTREQYSTSSDSSMAHMLKRRKPSPRFYGPVRHLLQWMNRNIGGPSSKHAEISMRHTPLGQVAVSGPVQLDSRSPFRASSSVRQRRPATCKHPMRKRPPLSEVFPQPGNSECWNIKGCCLQLDEHMITRWSSGDLKVNVRHSLQSQTPSCFLIDPKAAGLAIIRLTST